MKAGVLGGWRLIEMALSAANFSVADAWRLAKRQPFLRREEVAVKV
jgi:hypothetical protein